MPGALQSMGSQRVGRDQVTEQHSCMTNTREIIILVTTY